MKQTYHLLQVLSLILVVPLTAVCAEQPSHESVSLSASSENIREMIQEIDEEMVFYYHDKLMSFGPRYTGSLSCILAGEYIFDEFTDMGLDTIFHDWNFDGFSSRNIVATLPGTDPSSNAIFILSAHYDCTPGSLGADDDGSGVAAVMAAAEVMSQYTFDHTIRFIAFSGEEVGTYGSFSYAKEAYQRGDNIVAVLNPDMVGYANTSEGGRMLRFFGHDRSKWIGDFASTVSETYMDLIDLEVESLPNYLGADHQPFVDYGYDGVWIAHHDDYPWANTPEDNPEHLNWTYQTKATKLLLAILAEFAITALDVQVLLTTPYEGFLYFFNRPILPMHLGRHWYQELRGITVLFGRAVASASVISQEDIQHVIFCIDDNFMYWDYEPPYEWRIQGKHYFPIGRHTLRVLAFTESGKIAADEMDIIIFTFSCQYGLW
jgi:hypothetical protein